MINTQPKFVTKIQGAFAVSAGMLCIPFFASALTDGALSSVQSAILFLGTFATYVWFVLRYVYLVLLGLPEAISSAVVNVLIVIVGIWAIQLHKSPQDWFLAMSFLMFMALWKDLEAVVRWMRDRHMSQEVRYHMEALLKDLLAGMVLLFSHLALRGHLLKPEAIRGATIAVASVWLLWSALCAWVKARAILLHLSERKDSAQQPPARDSSWAADGLTGTREE